METKLLSEKYRDRIAGVLNCHDRVVLTGTLQQFCYADGMTAYLKAHHIRIFDYTKFVTPLREEIREHADALAKAHGFQVEFIRKKNIRNGHSLLAAQLKRKGIAFELQDNAFVMIADFDRANQLAQQLNIVKLHRKLDGFVKRYCPTINSLNGIYHWSTMQAEYATDIVFKQQKDLQAIYPHLLETLIHSVKPENIATFLGQKLHGNYKGEMGNRFDVRILGSRIKHLMGPVSLKMYDKFGLILRLETTVNDVSFFREYREALASSWTDQKSW